MDASKKRREKLKSMGMCIECGKIKTDGSVRCPDCAQKARARNKKHTIAHPGEKHQRHKVKLKNDLEYRTRHRQRRAAWRWRKRLEVIALYGGKCKCCNETTKEWLQIDHVNKDGKLHRAEVGRSIKLLRNLLRYPDKYKIRLLCANCHFAISSYGRCPHELQKVSEDIASALVGK